jgi:hypothetical protein
MSDTWKKDSQSRPTDLNGDEDIIDLVEEIPEEIPQRFLSDLEKRLLDFGEPRPSAGSAAADLPDLADLGSFDFDEEDDEATGAPAASSGMGAGRPSVESDARPPARGSEIEEISDFDEQLLDAEDVLEVEDILEGPLPAKKGPEPQADEGLELIDVEEDEIDDAIVWFDDLDKETPSPEPSTEEAPPAAAVMEWGTDPGQETSALDVFAAHVESAFPETDMGHALAAAVFQPPVEPAPGVPLPAVESASPPAAPGLSSAEIEAAVERVIERKLGGTIESIIQQAIENAVSKEIERLKRLLLEDDDRGPAS